MNVPYLMSASDEATLKKILVEVNSSHSWPWKHNGTTVLAAVMILEVVNNWRSMLQVNILKKSETLNPNHFPLQEKYVTITILNDLCLHDEYFSCGKASQTEWLFESNLRSFGYFKGPTALWLLLDTSCKGNSYTRIGWALQSQIVIWRPK